MILLIILDITWSYIYIIIIIQEIGRVDDVIQGVDSQPENGDVGPGNSSASDCRAPTSYVEGHVITRQVLNSESIGYISSQSFARDDMVEEDGLYSSGIWGRWQAVDECLEGGISGSKESHLRVAAEGINKPGILNEGH